MDSDELVPLGMFAVAGLAEVAEHAAPAIRELANRTPTAWREPLARYLRDAHMALPLMEHTIDVFKGAFGTPGGSAIMTDGAFFWRLDTADYVEVHGVALPTDFEQHAQALSYTPPAIPAETARQVELVLADYYREGRDRGLLG